MLTIFKTIGHNLLAVGAGVALILSGFFTKAPPQTKPSLPTKQEAPAVSTESAKPAVAIPAPALSQSDEVKAKTVPVTNYQNYGWYTHNGQSMQYVNGQWYSTPQQNITPTTTPSTTPPSTSTIPTPTPSYSDLHCPKILKLEDSLGNSSNDRYLRGSFKKGDVKTITIKVTATNPQNLTLNYQFKDESGLTSLPQSQWLGWSTDNSLTLNLKEDINPGTNKFVWYSVDDKDGFTCSFDVDIQGIITYTVLP